MHKSTRDLILKITILFSVMGAGYHVSSATDPVSSIAYARSVYKTTQSINMRTGRSFSKSVVTRIPANRGVDVIEVYDGGAWAKIRWNGNTGYIHTMYLKLTKVSDSPSTTGSTTSKKGKTYQSDGYHMYATEKLTLRKSASGSSASLGTVQGGDDLLLINKSGSWYQVRHKGRYGWLPIRYVKDYAADGTARYTSSASTTSSKGSSSSEKGKGTKSAAGQSYQADGYHMVTTGSVNLRASASATSRRLDTLPRGTDVLLINETGSWYKVYVNKRYGYLNKSYVGNYSSGSTSTRSSSQSSTASTKNTTSQNSSGTSGSSRSDDNRSIRSDGYHMYARKQTTLKTGPGTSYSTRTTISQGTDLLIIDQSGSWYKVYHKSRYSWVKKADLKDYSNTSSKSTGSSSKGSSSGSTSTGSSQSNGVHTMTTRKQVRLLSGPNYDLSTLARLSKGTRVTVVDDWGYFVKVSHQGKTGYIHMDDLKKDKGYTSPSASAKTGGSTASTGSGVSSSNKKPSSATRSDRISIDTSASYSNRDIPVKGKVRNTSVSKVEIYLNGTYLDQAKVSGSSYSYTIPSQVTRPGSNELRVEASTGKGRLYQTRSIQVNKVPTIVIDPGHGGSDPGAIGRHKGQEYYEKDYDIKFAGNLKKELEKQGFRVIMTRSTDKWVDNSDRVRIAKKYDADLLFAMHHNAVRNSTSSGGLSIYPSVKYSPSTQASFTESRALAEMLATAYTSSGMSYRGAYRDIDISGHTLYIMRNAPMRTIMTEMGFITSSSDIKKITDPSFQAKLPKEMARQIYNFFYRKK